MTLYVAEGESLRIQTSEMHFIFLSERYLLTEKGLRTRLLFFILIFLLVSVNMGKTVCECFD